jgi:acyl-CoA thioester hydrolase
MNPNDFKHKIPVQVRFVDIDKLGHVNNAVYLSYFEMARVHYFDELVGERVNWYTTGMILGRSVVDYKMPVFLDDRLFVYTAVTRFGTKSFDISNILVKETNGKEEIASLATFTIVCYNYEIKSTIEIPAEWKKQIEDFEGIRN